MSPETINTIIAGAVTALVPTVVALGGIAVAYLRKKTGLQEDQLAVQREINLRDGLQSSLITAIGLYTQGKHDEAVQYVMTHSAEAVSHFIFSPTDISNMITRKAAAWAGVPAPEKCCTMIKSLTDPFPELVNEIIGKEGRYSNNPDDSGGETTWGITVFAARAFGYKGAMAVMPRDTAVQIYRLRYWSGVRFNDVWDVDADIGEKLFDIGVNMGQTTGVAWLQRSLNSLNNKGTDFPDMKVDGVIGNLSLASMRAFISKRGELGRKVLLNMIKSMQSVRYVEIAEGNEKNETFEYGWQAQRALA